MKRILFQLLFVGILLFVTSCTKDFDNINTPKTSVTKVPPAYLFLNMEGAPFANYQRNVNLYPDLYSQYWANTVDGFGSPRYEYNDGWIGNQWKEHYDNYVRFQKDLVEQAGTNPIFSNEIAESEIFICYRWAVITDANGDIPYVGASEGKVVKYTAQKDIYYDLLARLTKAVNTLKEDATQVSFGDYDLMYKGNVAQWKKFGNSLRLRLAMRMSNVDPQKAQAEAVAAITAGVMESNADAAKMPIDPSSWTDYLHQMAVNWGNVRVSKTFTDYLNTQSSVVDPRANLWLTKTPAGTFEGVANGYLKPTVSVPDWESKSTMNRNSDYKDFGVNLAVPILFYSEVVFLKAEATLRGWVPGDVTALYKAGVKASMDYVGVANADANAYIATLPAVSGSNEAKLKQIITQKWIGNFPNGVEAWADFRRTDYPDLRLPIDGVSGNASVAPNTFVKRIRYPDNQHNLNEKSMPESLNTIAKDRMDVKVWWDKTGDGTYGNF